MGAVMTAKVTTSTRLTTLVTGWVDEAVAKYALGDRVTWDCQLALTDQGPKLLVVFFMPGAVMGTQLQNVVSVDAPGLMTEAEASELTRAAIEQLRIGRSEQMHLVVPGSAPATVKAS